LVPGTAGTGSVGESSAKDGDPSRGPVGFVMSGLRRLARVVAASVDVRTWR
jgi:hypothetical protein